MEDRYGSAGGPKTLDPRCPCVRCRNRHRAKKEVMKQHLWAYGYMSGFITTVDCTQNEHDRGDVMRQRIDGIEYDGMRNFLPLSSRRSTLLAQSLLLKRLWNGSL